MWILHRLNLRVLLSLWPPSFWNRVLLWILWLPSFSSHWNVLIAQAKKKAALSSSITAEFLKPVEQRRDCVKLFFFFSTFGKYLSKCSSSLIYTDINLKRKNSRHQPPRPGPEWVISERVLSLAQTNELHWMEAFIKSTLNSVSSVSACRSHSAWLAP